MKYTLFVTPKFVTQAEPEHLQAILMDAVKDAEQKIEAPVRTVIVTLDPQEIR